MILYGTETWSLIDVRKVPKGISILFSRAWCYAIVLDLVIRCNDVRKKLHSTLKIVLLSLVFLASACYKISFC